MWINIILFIVYATVATICLISDNHRLCNPLNRSKQLLLNGPEFLWIIIFSTGTLALQADLAIDLMAIRLGLIEMFCIVGIVMLYRRPVFSFPLWIYVCFLAWIGVGVFVGNSVAYGIRTVLKYLYPLLIAMFASTAVKDIELWLKSSLYARYVAFFSLIFLVIPALANFTNGLFWYITASAINYISIMVLSLALIYFSDKRFCNLLWSLVFLLPCFFWVLRTSILGSFVAIMSFFVIRYRLKSLPIIASIIIIAVVSVFCIPGLHDKMFMSDVNINSVIIEGNTNLTDNIQTNARGLLWWHLTDSFYNGHEMLGSGTGTVQQYLYSHNVFGGIKAPHGDFVQIICDNGLIGLLLYLIMALSVFIHCCRVYNKYSVEIKLAAIVAGSSYAGVFVTMLSENTVNYSMATLSMPFGFYGMLMGLIERHKSQGRIAS